MKNARAKSLRANKGFSLIEIVIVVAIATSIVFVIGSLSGNTNVLNTLVSRELQSKSDVDQNLQIVTTAIRSATQSANGSYPIVSANSSSFVFYSNGASSGTINRVRYFLASSTIYGGVIQPTGTPAIYPTSSEIITDLVDGVSTFGTSSLFLYYDDTYSGPTSSAMTSTIDVSSIRLVGLSFYTTVAPSSSPAPQYFSRLINIRNLRVK